LQFDRLEGLAATHISLFLDFDGTLVDIAPTPLSISVPHTLIPLLKRLLSGLDGRVCIVSGRTLSDIDRFSKGLGIDVVAEHGAVHRLSGVVSSALPAWPASWREHLQTLNQCIPKLEVEIKTTGVAFHYRQQPELEAEIMQFAEVLRNHAPDDFVVVTSNMTTEIRRAHIDKGKAIEAVMKTARYHGTTPIFIADDVTDIPGFEVARGLGGQGLHVGTDFAGKTENVRSWLDLLVIHLKAAS
jgi:trehalose 6-phosphate phosphatase